MPRRSCDGAGFLSAFRSAVACLEANVDEVNALNVFPVPDGDTGTNMLATVRAALDEADKAGPTADAERMAQAAAFGALMGARGNSGVITSQILKGIEAGFVGKRRFNGLDLAHALDLGAKTAYKAVARPVEGTILTVIRESAAAAVAAAERDNNVETVLVATVEAAERAVAKTPSLLPILREAHVVDSGGQGLFRLFQGALEAARGRPLADAVPVGVMDGPRVEAVAAPVDATEFGYETVFLVRALPGHPLDLPAMQAHLEAIGESVLVAGDAHMAKVHVHNARPDGVIAYGLSLGALSRITVENLDGQAHDVREARAAAFVAEGGDATSFAVVAATAIAEAAGPASEAPAGTLDDPATRLPLGVVAVAPSDGLAAILADAAIGFREYGAFRIVRGGQGANPSTGELLEAVEATKADELLILPNNPNVTLAARQVASMTDRPVHVVPTRNVAEGVAALFELERSAPAAQNAIVMTEAAHAIQTMQVTEAVRDATVSGHKVKKGQTIALDPDDGLLAVDGDPHRAILAAFARLEAGFSLVTLFYGEDASLDDAELLAQRIHEAAPGLEAVEVRHGGQPHYRYLISAE
jgi:DAK2 domain fusion protein YloV